MKLRANPSRVFSTFFYLGYFPFAPGTVGSLAAILVYALIIRHFSIFTQLVIILILFSFGVLSSGRVEKEDEKNDPGYIIIDEVVGMFIALLGLGVNWVLFLLAFIIFRLLDIGKPLGIRKTEKLYSGLGIMLDDILAGFYTLIIVRIISWVFL